MSVSNYVRVPRPTEDAALRAVSSSRRARPGVPALLAALLEANARGDREGVCLSAHAAVRAALGGEVGAR
ncbi:hypothetical protein AN219_37665 [Streptomyces nanshensis]|nr:hypothetical protein AN219_37665 [Streptomyces nanshensis]